MREADTSPEAARVQREVWRRMSGARRLTLALEMSDEARAISRAGIRRRHPQYDEVANDN